MIYLSLSSMFNSLLSFARQHRMVACLFAGSYAVFIVVIVILAMQLTKERNLAAESEKKAMLNADLAEKNAKEAKTNEARAIEKEKLAITERKRAEAAIEEKEREVQKRVEAVEEYGRKSTPTFYEKAQSLMDQDEPDFVGALEYIDLAIRLDPNQAEYHNLKGNILQSSFQFAGAKEAYQKAIQHSISTEITSHATENLKLCEKIIREGGNVSRKVLDDLFSIMIKQGRGAEAVVVQEEIKQFQEKSRR